MIEFFDRSGYLIFFKKLIPLVISFGLEDLCVHPLHFALEFGGHFLGDLVYNAQREKVRIHSIR
jgi:hypothetical protein